MTPSHLAGDSPVKASPVEAPSGVMNTSSGEVGAPACRSPRDRMAGKGWLLRCDLWRGTKYTACRSLGSSSAREDGDSGKRRYLATSGPCGIRRLVRELEAIPDRQRRFDSRRLHHSFRDTVVPIALAARCFQERLDRHPRLGEANICRTAVDRNSKLVEMSPPKGGSPGRPRPGFHNLSSCGGCCGPEPARCYHVLEEALRCGTSSDSSLDSRLTWHPLPRLQLRHVIPADDPKVGSIEGDRLW